MILTKLQSLPHLWVHTYAHQTAVRAQRRQGQLAHSFHMHNAISTAFSRYREIAIYNKRALNLKIIEILAACNSNNINNNNSL